MGRPNECNIGPTARVNTNYIWTDDYCDCDERCPRCGKKKKPKSPYTVTYGDDEYKHIKPVRYTCGTRF